VSRGRRRKLEALPLREELETLAHHYRHLHNEHVQAGPESSVRRELEKRLEVVRERFERLLEEWVADEEQRRAWREWLDGHGPEPPQPGAVRLLVFAGRSEVTGSVVEIRRRDRDELEVWVDGALIERVAGEKDFAGHVPGLRFPVDGVEFEEVFNAPAEAVQALADFLDEEGAPPPWEHATELLADGLIDVRFDLTPRGRRALAQAGR
jgi:hypothetical protein